MELAQWVEQEFAHADLGDARRVRRAKRLVWELAQRPESSIPAVCASEAATKAAYRFLSNDGVTAAALRQSHQQATRTRLAEQKARVLIAQDTTNLDFSGRASTTGLGILDSVYARGLKVHTALAMTSEGVPLGVLHQEVWAREESGGRRGTRRQRQTAQKESQRWLTTAALCAQGLPEGVAAWLIGDRESDLYDLFAAPRPAPLQLLVRAAQDRRVQKEGDLSSLWEAVLATAVQALHTIEVPRTQGGEAARQAVLEMRFTSLEVLPPRHAQQRAHKAPVPLSVVHVREIEAPAGEKPLEWLLLCTETIASVEEALFCIEAYRQRWKVERYHYVLKSGCKIEELQLESAARIERALALYSIVAWRLLWLCYQAREAPQAPCTVALEEDEWKALSLHTHRALPGKGPPSLHEAVRWIAQLGGFVGRRHQAPGVKVLWRGWRRLADITHTYRLLQNVGNG